MKAPTPPSEDRLLLSSLGELDWLWRDLLHHLRPRHLLEIGAEGGGLTRTLLEWIDQAGAGTALTVIDPAPDPLHQPWMEHPAVRFFRRPSLEVLPFLPIPEIAFLDGDHNAWTLRGELRGLLPMSGPRPSVLVLHDTGWPWGHRDLYYDPERIPAVHRHSYSETDGPIPGSAELADWGYAYPGRFVVGTNEPGKPAGTRAALDPALAGGVLAGWEHLFLPAIFGISLLWDPKKVTADTHRFLTTLRDSLATWEPLISSLEENRTTLFLHYLRNFRLASYRDWELGQERMAHARTRAREQAALSLLRETEARRRHEFRELEAARRSQRLDKLFAAPWFPRPDPITPAPEVSAPRGRWARALARGKAQKGGAAQPVRPERDLLIEFWDLIWDALLELDFPHEQDKAFLNTWRHRWQAFALERLALGAPIPLPECLRLVEHHLLGTPAHPHLELLWSNWLAAQTEELRASPPSWLPPLLK